MGLVEQAFQQRRKGHRMVADPYAGFFHIDWPAYLLRQPDQLITLHLNNTVLRAPGRNLTKTRQGRRRGRGKPGSASCQSNSRGRYRLAYTKSSSGYRMIGPLGFQVVCPSELHRCRNNWSQKEDRLRQDTVAASQNTQSPVCIHRKPTAHTRWQCAGSHEASSFGVKPRCGLRCSGCGRLVSSRSCRPWYWL